MAPAGNARILARLVGVANKAEIFQQRNTNVYCHFNGGNSIGRHPMSMFTRTVTTMPLTKSIHLVTNTDDIKRVPDQPLQVTSPARPLSIILSWLMSEKKHIMKYASFYLDQQIDVLVVQITPSQLLWPTTGTQVVARDLLKIICGNESYRPLIIHGFSVGGYLWGEVLNIMTQDAAKYKPVLDQISGQIWDSVVDFEGIPKGMPKAIFPKKSQFILRNSLEMYIRGHMAAFHNVATKHYLRSSKCYHNSIVRAPALFMCSLDDPVGAVSGIRKVASNWVSMGMQVHVKEWDSSPHVSHLHHHPEEYNQEMKTFLEMLGLVPFPEKFLLKVASRA